MNRQAIRVLPWVICAVLAVAVWRDHSRTLVPWLISLATTFATGWAFGRRRRYTRRAPRQAPRTIRPTRIQVPVPVVIQAQPQISVAADYSMVPTQPVAPKKPRRPTYTEQEKSVLRAVFKDLDTSGLGVDLGPGYES